MACRKRLECDAFRGYFWRLFFHTECGGAPNHLPLCMTRMFAAVRARTELSMMRVLMTIREFGGTAPHLEIIMGWANTCAFTSGASEQGYFDFSSGRNPGLLTRVQIAVLL